MHTWLRESEKKDKTKLKYKMKRNNLLTMSLAGELTLSMIVLINLQIQSTFIFYKLYFHHLPASSGSLMLQVLNLQK